jgi:hypothetical protein
MAGASAVSAHVRSPGDYGKPGEHEPHSKRRGTIFEPDRVASSGHRHGPPEAVGMSDVELLTIHGGVPAWVPGIGEYDPAARGQIGTYSQGVEVFGSDSGPAARLGGVLAPVPSRYRSVFVKTGDTTNMSAALAVDTNEAPQLVQERPPGWVISYSAYAPS